MIPPEPHGRDVHPDLDTLADLQEGLLPPTPAAAVSDHLDGCEQCRDDFAALQALPQRLAAAGDVGPMPDDLVARLEDTLSRETPAAAVTVVPLTSARRDRPSWDNRVLQAAAAVVVVLAATAVGVAALQGNGADLQTATDDSAAGEAAREFSAGSVPVLSTGTDYTQESVVSAVPRLLDSDGAVVRLEDSPKAADSSAGAEQDSRLSTGPALSSCVKALADDPDTPTVEMPTPLVVDIARFNEQAATVIVLPTSDEADRLDVFVVGPQCGPADAKVLHFARVPRP